MTYAERQAAVTTAAASFPETFSLRAFPTGTFRISVQASFWSADTGVQLVLQKRMSADEQTKFRLGEWADFGRDTPETLRAEIIGDAVSPSQCGACGALGHITSVCPRPVEAPSAVVDAVDALMDVAITRHHDGHADETFVECHVCGRWEDHAADCFVPALTRWINGGAK